MKLDYQWTILILVFTTSCAAFKVIVHQDLKLPPHTDDHPAFVLGLGGASSIGVKHDGLTVASAMMKVCDDSSEAFRKRSIEIASHIDSTEGDSHGPVQRVAEVVFKNDRKHKQTATVEALGEQMAGNAAQLRRAIFRIVPIG